MSIPDLLTDMKSRLVGYSFPGPDYVPWLDHDRLASDALKVFGAMTDGKWWTLKELSDLTGSPQASVSAHIRLFRRASCGGYIVDRRRRGDPKRGLSEYRLNLDPEAQHTAEDLDALREQEQRKQQQRKEREAVKKASEVNGSFKQSVEATEAGRLFREDPEAWAAACLMKHTHNNAMKHAVWSNLTPEQQARLKAYAKAIE